MNALKHSTGISVIGRRKFLLGLGGGLVLGAAGWEKFGGIAKRAIEALGASGIDQNPQPPVHINTQPPKAIPVEDTTPGKETINNPSEDTLWKQINTIPGTPGELGFFLTSDDGSPLRPHDTLAFAEWLNTQGVQAHFFINGRNDSGPIYRAPTPKEYQELVRFIGKIAALGHSVHNHSWNHTSMAAIKTTEQLEAYLLGIRMLQKAIREGAPDQKEHYFRYAGGREPEPTSIRIQQAIEKTFRESGIDAAIYWTHDTEDWKSSNDIASAWQRALREGGTLLMHDRKWKLAQGQIIQILKTLPNVSKK